MTRTNDDFRMPSSATIEQSMKHAHALRSAAFTTGLRRLFSWPSRESEMNGGFAPAE